MELEFWLLDVSYDIVGGVPEVQLWGLDRSGNRVLVVDRSFRPYFYVLPVGDPEEVARALRQALTAYGLLSVEQLDRRFFGKPSKVLRVTLMNPREVPSAREAAAKLKGVKEVLEADIRFYMRYMVDNDVRPSAWHVVNVDELKKPSNVHVDDAYLALEAPRYVGGPPPNLKVYAIDIECYNKYGEPIPERDPVILISRATRDGVEVFSAEQGETALLKEFLDDFWEQDPDVVVGYNSNRFDIPYLIRRAHENGLKLKLNRNGGEPAQSVYGHFSMVGRANIDLYDYASELAGVKLKTLDHVADYLGLVKRSERVLLDASRIYEYWDSGELRAVLKQYSADDARSAFLIGEAVLPFAIQLSEIVGLPLDQIFAASVGNRVEWFLIRQAFKRGELAPNSKERKEETYKGAIVLSPRPGIHRNIAVLDFSSMYPNIMIKYNISPDTYISPVESVPEGEVNVAPEVGHKFRKNPPGFFRSILEELIRVRREIVRRMRELSPESEEFRILEERQKAVKVITNAVYGYTGWPPARWYMREVAEATTAWGRVIIKETIRKAQELGLTVIYGDTDSIFVVYEPERVSKLIDYVNAEMGFEIKVDRIYSKIFFTEAKKRYCGFTLDGKIEIVGLEAVRGDWAELSKDIQEKVVEIILVEENPWRAVEYVRSVISDLYLGKVPLEKLIIWKTLTKELDEYEVDAPHVQAARMLARAGYRVYKGMKIGYVVTKYGSSKVSDRAKPHILVRSPDEVDVEYYVEHQVVPAALRILEYFGVRREHLISKGKGQASLLDFFG
ncbi:MAG: DNA polymerase II [Thermofilum sp.]